MGRRLCAAGPTVEEGPKSPASRLTQTAAGGTRTPCPSGRGGTWRRTGKVDRWSELGDARRAAICEGGRGGRHFVVAWAGRRGRGGPVVLQGLRDGGVAKGPDGTKGFEMARTRRVRRVEAMMVDASRLVEGMQRGLGQLRRELEQLWKAARLWWRENQGRVLHTAVFVLLVALVRVVTGVGCVAACFLAVLAAVPCAFLVLVLGAVCVHVWTLVRWAPTTTHVEVPAGWVDCVYHAQIDASLGEERGGESLCREEEEDEVDEEEEARCVSADCWCRHTSSKTLSRKRCGTASAETGCRRRTTSAKLQNKVWDPGRSPRVRETMPATAVLPPHGTGGAGRYCRCDSVHTLAT